MTEDWKRRAACRNANTAVFFPERVPGKRPAVVAAAIAEALSYCARCEVCDECLTYANTSPVAREGIWGGQSERQRRRYRWKRRVGIAS